MFQSNIPIQISFDILNSDISNDKLSIFAII